MNVHCRHDEIVSRKALKPHPKNRNAHPPDQVARLAQLLKYQGFRAPVIVSKLSNYIVKGHGTCEAAWLNGWDEVPVVYQEFESEEQEYAFLQSDNAIASWAELDLKAINADIGELGPDFDIDLLGIKDFVVEPADKFQGDEDAVPEAPKEARTKPGELWILGNHRLLCGDSTDKAQVGRLMNGEKAEMVFTDPPYNHASGNDLVASPVRQAMQKLKDSEWDKHFDIGPALQRIDEVSSKDATFYVCTSWHLAGEIWKFFSTRSNHYSYCVWRKTNPMPSLMKRHWTWSSELIVYATRGKHTFNFPSEGHAPNVWDIQKNRANDLHPTMKPVEVPELAIIHSSNRGDLIWDGFLGSGSTLIACEKTNRKCYGMEIDPVYCDVIISRWEKFTGKQAIREDGVKWQDLESK